MRGWRAAGIATILSLLTRHEERELDLAAEPQIATETGLKFLSLPIPDRDVPTSPSQVAPVLDELDKDLSTGKNVVIHCRQGIGRSGMMAACLLVLRGSDPESAVNTVQEARGLAVPETPEQRHWIDLFASTLTGTR
jgi:protein-tyrosine phosphatase